MGCKKQPPPKKTVFQTKTKTLGGQSLTQETPYAHKV